VGAPVARAAITVRRSDIELIENVHYALQILQGKWKVHLVCLMARGVRGHGKLLECLPRRRVEEGDGRQAACS
jgi:hypothetical protein